MNDLIGKTLTDVEVNRGDGEDSIVFTVSETEKYRMYHYQDCCENVSINDICGDMDDLVGCKIAVARVSHKEGEGDNGWGDSYTWTFYTIGTEKGFVDIRWYGSSNGYYSERVTFERSDDKGNFSEY